MNILITLLPVIIGISIAYWLVYSFAKMISAITIFFRIAWITILAFCGVIAVYIAPCGNSNYVLLLVFFILFIKLLIAHGRIKSGELDKKHVIDHEDYTLGLKKIYGNLYTFLIFGLLFANIEYLLLVKTGSIAVETYQSSSLLYNIILSAMGFAPIKWFIFVPTLIAVLRANGLIRDFASEAVTSVQKDAAPKLSSKTSIQGYYSQVLGLPVDTSMASFDAIHTCLVSYFSKHTTEKNREALVCAAEEAALFEITDTNEIISLMVESSGLSNEEILKILPSLTTNPQEVSHD